MDNKPRAEEFKKIGTSKSKGTKVFALAGKVARGGLIEVAMGTTIREIVENIGNGVAPGRKFKAVQIGGTFRRCIPESLADTPIDYEELIKLGAMMGSGGLVVLDDADCMVDMAKYFLTFTHQQSCGKCTFCRVGTKKMLDILERLSMGKALLLNWMNWNPYVLQLQKEACAVLENQHQIRLLPVSDISARSMRNIQKAYAGQRNVNRL